MNQIQSMSELYAQQQKGLLSHFEQCRKNILEQLSQWIEKQWVQVDEIQVWPKKNNFDGHRYAPLHYFEITISNGYYPVTDNATSIQFLSNGEVQFLKNILVFDEDGTIADFFNENRDLIEQMDVPTMESTIELLKKLLEYFSKIEDFLFAK